MAHGVELHVRVERPSRVADGQPAEGPPLPRPAGGGETRTGAALALFAEVVLADLDPLISYLVIDAPPLLGALHATLRALL